MIEGLDNKKTYFAKNPLVVKITGEQDGDEKFKNSKINDIELQITLTTKAGNVIDYKTFKLYGYGHSMNIDLSTYINFLIADTEIDKTDIPKTFYRFYIFFQSKLILSDGSDYFLGDDLDGITFIDGGVVSDEINIEAPKSLYVYAPLYFFDNELIPFGNYYNEIQNNEIVRIERTRENTPMECFIHSNYTYPLRVKFINHLGGYSFFCFDSLEEKTEIKESELVTTYNDLESKTVKPILKRSEIKKEFTAKVEVKSIFYDLLVDLISSSYIINYDTGKQMLLKGNNLTKTNAKTIDFNISFSYISGYKSNL